MERTHLMLHPGEEIRTPRILLLFWEGDRVRSQNMLRRLILAHHTPRPNGELLQPPFSDGAWGARSTASHLANIAWLRDNRIGAECYWIDAGWYGDQPVAAAADGLSNAWAREVGSWNAQGGRLPRRAQTGRRGGRGRRHALPALDRAGKGLRRQHDGPRTSRMVARPPAF